MQELTVRQQEVLDLIRRYQDLTGYPPTRADIARGITEALSRRAELSLKGRARALQRSWASSADATARIYRELAP